MATCIACSEAINHSASRCHHCGSYQNQWKNRLPMIGVGTVIGTFVVSIFVVIHSPTNNLWNELFGKAAIEIISYNSLSQITILNTGDRKVLIENVTEKNSEYPYTRVSTIQDVVNENDIYSNTQLTSGNEVKWSFVQNLTEKAWEEIKLGNVKNIVPIVYSENHPHLELLFNEYGKSLKQVEAECTIQYRSIKNNSVSIRKPFPCVGVMVLIPSK